MKPMTPGLLALLFLSPEAAAERLPCKTYSIADGLPHNHVTSILQDSRGFIWFGTLEGLARFDGVNFRNYDTRDGLPSRAVGPVFETRDHTLWIGTPRGLCRFDPEAGKGRLFQCSDPAGGRSRQVQTLFEDSSGNLWVGTERGPYRVLRSVSGQGAGTFAFEAADIGIAPEEPDRSIRAFVEHPKGVIWAAGGGGIYRRMPLGETARLTTREGLPQNVVTGLMRDREGRIWAAFWDQGLALLVKDPQPGKPAVERVFRYDSPRHSNRAIGIFQTLDGRFLSSLGNGITEISLDPRRPLLRGRLYTKAHGLSSDLPADIAEDREGNLWVASSDAGAMKISRDGFAAYGLDDGLSRLDASFLAEDPREGVVVGWAAAIHRFDGERFEAVVPNLPREMFRDLVLLGWGWNQSVLRDHEGDWWIPTERGIFRFARPKRLADLARARPKANYTTRDGLTANGVFRLFEDSRGDVWISLMAEGLQTAVWERQRNRIVLQRVKGDAADQKTGAPTAFAEDRDGNIWIGFYDGGLARRRQGQWSYFDPSAGAPAGFVNDMLVDQAGRLWIAYSGGLKRVDDPRAAAPGFVTYTKDHGLPSSSITALAEDRFGRIYLGMNSRISRLDPRFPSETARLKHYTAGDGVLNGNVRAMRCDRQGAIWAVSVNGVARLKPEPPQPAPPFPVRIVGLKAGGTPQRLSEFGAVHAAGYSFPNRGATVEIEFASLSFVPGRTHAYSHKVEGAEETWSRPSPANAVTLAALAPGNYRFLVKAISHDSDAESRPAVLEFSIAAPLYQRAWFWAMLALAAASGVIVFYHVRWKRAVELERIRMQIATDLHDELGAGLSQVSMISEIALLAPKEEQRSEALNRVARLSRELLDSAGDLVWAIRPSQNLVSDLAQRMRAFATEALSAPNIRFEFNVAPEAVHLRLDPEQRRQVFAVFKESIHNAIRHSGCARVRADLLSEDGTLVLATTDDGKGLGATGDPETSGRHGIAGMRWRAQTLGGSLELDSPSGNGLRVTLRVPLEQRRRQARPAKMRRPA